MALCGDEVGGVDSSHGVVRKKHHRLSDLKTG